MEVIANIWQGRAGLAKTFWGYHLLGGLLWGILFFSLRPGSPGAVVLAPLYLAYFVVVIVGIWRAAGLYEGPRHWALIARGVLVAWGLMFVAGVLASMLIPTQATQHSATYGDASWTQESTRSTEAGPWLDYSPTGTRFCRAPDGTIFMVFPPGAKPDAQIADPACLSASVDSAEQL